MGLASTSRFRYRRQRQLPGRWSAPETLGRNGKLRMVARNKGLDASLARHPGYRNGNIFARIDKPDGFFAGRSDRDTALAIPIAEVCLKPTPRPIAAAPNFSRRRSIAPCRATDFAASGSARSPRSAASSGATTAPMPISRNAVPSASRASRRCAASNSRSGSTVGCASRTARVRAAKRRRFQLQHHAAAARSSARSRPASFSASRHNCRSRSAAPSDRYRTWSPR